MKLIKKQNGISIIAAIFALIILGIFGMTIVTLVNFEHETRAGNMLGTAAFYDTQAGFEFALREIDQGGYPLGSRIFSKGNFNVAISYDESSKRELIVTGAVTDIQKKYQISHDTFGADCIQINYAEVSTGGDGNRDLLDLSFRKICNEAINIDKIVIAWTPDANEKVTEININSVIVWEDLLGLGTGSSVNIADTRVSTIGDIPISHFRFTFPMSGKTITMIFVMSDSTTRTISFLVP